MMSKSLYRFRIAPRWLPPSRYAGTRSWMYLSVTAQSQHSHSTVCKWVAAAVQVCRHPLLDVPISHSTVTAQSQHSL